MKVSKLWFIFVNFSFKQVSGATQKDLNETVKFIEQK